MTTYGRGVSVHGVATALSREPEFNLTLNLDSRLRGNDDLRTRRVSPWRCDCLEPRPIVAVCAGDGGVVAQYDDILCIAALRGNREVVAAGDRGRSRCLRVDHDHLVVRGLEIA